MSLGDTTAQFWFPYTFLERSYNAFWRSHDLKVMIFSIFSIPQINLNLIGVS